MSRIPRRAFLTTSAATAAAFTFESLLTPVVAADATEFLTVKDFGAVGDGRTNNTPALQALRNYLLKDTTRAYNILFPAGTYCYDNNNWLAQCGVVTLHGDNAKLCCTYGGGYGGDKAPLSAPFFFRDYGNDRPGNWRGIENFGYRINTANAGATSIKFITPSDAARFSVGDRVLIHGFDQQFGGYPPNMRYFEWNAVTAVDTTAGSLLLARGLKYQYRADWCDTNYSEGVYAGKARVCNLDRINGKVLRSLTIRGIEFLINPNAPGPDDNAFQVCADDLLLENVVIPGESWPGFNRTFTANNTQFRQTVQGDKWIDVAKFSKCSFAPTNSGTTIAIDAFTGVNNAIFEDCKIDGVPSLAPRRAEFRRNIINVPATHAGGALISYGGGWYTDLLYVEDNTIAHSTALQAAFQTSRRYDIPLVGVSPAGELLLPNTPLGTSVVQQLGPGAIIYNTTMSQRGRVTSITFDGTYHVVAGTWIGVPRVEDKWRFVRLNKFWESGTAYIGDRLPTVDCYNLISFLRDTSSGTVRMDGPFGFLPDRSVYRSVFPFGFLRRITIDVTKPCTGPGIGADTNPRVNLDTFSPIYQGIFSCPLTSIGRFVLGVNGYTSDFKMNPPATLSATQCYEEINFAFYGCGGTPEQMPELSIEIEFVSGFD